MPVQLQQKTSVKQLTPSIELSVSSTEFQNKRIIFIKYNGQIDSTFDVSAPDSSTLFELQSNFESDTFMIEKKCLLGDNLDLKLSVLINHVSKLIYTKAKGGEAKNLIVSLSSKLFKTDSGLSDFDVIILILQSLSEII
ncbi:hypothetical protein WICPIJ_008076 [Wickerhamomyces pijperi]|uniref:Uncharacterized protein n=1 Tax=Wickerhamomyces pijperi TaxID=599730 RepID=A0A9P8PYK5_WICPI|nr:hypothetical protein WICPIJ_008076 [Wickerhamomyces pijperi]